MKRISQVRDRALVAPGGAVEEMFLIRPALAENARVVWPDADLRNLQSVPSKQNPVGVAQALAADHRNRGKSQAETRRTLRATTRRKAPED